MPEPGESTESALALLEYPGRFPLKVFGRQSADLEAQVLALVRA